MITLFLIRPKGFNVGNDAIYLGTQHFIYEAFGEVVNLISLPATSRYESQAKAGLTARTIHEINQYGHGVILGGGNIYENGELDIDLDALEALEPPLMLFSLSRGRVYNRQRQLKDRTDAMPQRVIKALDRKARFALFRDSATGSHLEGLGCGHTAVGGCPTIFLDRMTDHLPRLPDARRRGALISVRNPNLMSIPLSKRAQVYADVPNLIDLLRSEGYDDVRLLCHDHRDIEFAASFADVEFVYTGDVTTYLAMLRSCALSVTYRLHAFLPCMAFGTPTIKISYDERSLSLIDTVGLGRWNIDMVRSDDTVSEVYERLQRLDELDALRVEARFRWQELYKINSRTFREFAREVRAYGEALAPAESTAGPLLERNQGNHPAFVSRQNEVNA
jgi:hypothetical protein